MSWSPYPYGLPPCICGEEDRHRAKYHRSECPRWVFLMRAERKDPSFEPAETDS